MNDGPEFAQDAAVLRWLMKRMVKSYGKKVMKHLIVILMDGIT